MRAARRPGSQQASSATTVSTRRAATRVSGSSVAIPNTKASRRRTDAAESSRPRSAPAATSPGSLADDEGHDGAALRSEGHAKPDFTAALRHRVAEQGADAEGGEEQREAGEEPDADRVEAGLGDGRRQVSRPSS